MLGGGLPQRTWVVQGDPGSWLPRIARGKCPDGLGKRRTEPHLCTPVKYRICCLTQQEACRPSDRLPSRRRLAWVLVLDLEALSSDEATTLTYILQDAEVALLHGLSRTYRQMVREKRPEDFGEWLTACAESGIRPMQTFAKGLQQDYAAVHAALTPAVRVAGGPKARRVASRP